MKYSLALGLILSAFATNVMAETSASTPAKAAEMPAMGNEMPDPMRGQRNMKDRMNNHMERMWKDLDANGDGEISKTESDEFSNKKFDGKDANKDGKITREEWDAFRDTKRAEMQGKMDKKHGDMPMGKPETQAAPADSKK